MSYNNSHSTSDPDRLSLISIPLTPQLNLTHHAVEEKNQEFKFDDNYSFRNEEESESSDEPQSFKAASGLLLSSDYHMYRYRVFLSELFAHGLAAAVLMGWLSLNLYHPGVVSGRHPNRTFQFLRYSSILMLTLALTTMALNFLYIRRIRDNIRQQQYNKAVFSTIVFLGLFLMSVGYIQSSLNWNETASNISAVVKNSNEISFVPIVLCAAGVFILWRRLSPAKEARKIPGTAIFYMRRNSFTRWTVVLYFIMLVLFSFGLAYTANVIELTFGSLGLPVFLFATAIVFFSAALIKQAYDKKNKKKEKQGHYSDALIFFVSMGSAALLIGLLTVRNSFKVDGIAWIVVGLLMITAGMFFKDLTALCRVDSGWGIGKIDAMWPIFLSAIAVSALVYLGVTYFQDPDLLQYSRGEAILSLSLLSIIFVSLLVRAVVLAHQNKLLTDIEVRRQIKVKKRENNIDPVGLQSLTDMEKY
jgi:hypothetical protein